MAMLVAAALSLNAAPTAAQDMGAAPAGSLFGSGASARGRSRLDFTFALNEARDSQLPQEFTSRISQGAQQTGGYSTMLNGNAAFTHDRRRVTVTGNAFTAMRYYEPFGFVSPVGHNAAVGATFRMPWNTTAELDQTGAYSPSFLYQLFPTLVPPALGDAIPIAANYQVNRQKSFAYNSSATLAMGTPRGLRFSVTAQYQRTNLELPASAFRITNRPDLETYGGRARLSHGVGRSNLVSAEYVYRTGEFGYGGISIEHRLQIGGEYSKALSASRRATFRMNVAPSSLVIPATPLTTQAGGRSGTLYRLQGDASGEYQFRRTWALNGSVRRGVEYIALFQTPVFSDAARLGLGGLVTRRVDVSASAGYAVGETAFTRNQLSPRFDTYTGTVRVRYALASSLALYSEYLYYYYDLRGQLGLAPGLPTVFDQHGVRVGVMLWVPTFGR